MSCSGWPRTTQAILLAAGVLVGAGLTTRPASTQATDAKVDTHVTLSVYTCCGSLAGFNDTTPTDLTSMHALYAGRWAQLFPHLRWRETAFTDQRAMETRLAAAVRVGTPPDMVFVQGGDIGDLVVRGLAQPLDRYFTREHIPDGYFLPSMGHWAHLGGHWWAIPAVSGPLGGQQIFLPKYMAPLGYNNGTLRTFFDYYQMSKKAVRFDTVGHLTRIGYWPGADADSWQTTGTLMCAPGHGLYNAAHRPTATDPCNLEYLRYLKKLVDLYGGYAQLTAFLARDPDPELSKGDPRGYMVSGKALMVPWARSYWNIVPFDTLRFGAKDGLAYQLTPLPPTRHGAQSEVATYPSTMQEIIIPPGAHHPDLAFAVSKMMFWDNGYLLGRSLSGSPVAYNLHQWLGEAITGEGAVRHEAGLPGNPAASLQGLKMQPVLGRVSRASNPINPVDPYYQQQLVAETKRVLSGQEAPAHALEVVQRRVLAQEQHLQAQHGNWLLNATLPSQSRPGIVLYRASARLGGLEIWSGSSEWRHAADGTLYNDGSRKDSLILAPYDLGKFAHYEVDAEMKVAPAQTHCPFGFGIVVRWEHHTGLYSSADCHGGPAELWVGPLQGARRIAARPFTMRTGWLTYRLRVQGATISYSVRDGDRLLASLQATGPVLQGSRGGQIGLWTHHDRFSVRDFKVQTLP